MGRILRIGNDTLTNYSFLATSAYDAGNPAATTSPWPDSFSMDTPFNEIQLSPVSEQGVLVTFDRLPSTFNGSMVKIQPTYNVSGGEDPFFELWTHDDKSGLWTKRRSIELKNLFVGVESGQNRILDLTFFPYLSNVDKVWLTMNPGAVGTPAMNFIEIQMFGQCESALRHEGGGPNFDGCDKSHPETYTGFKVLNNGDIVPCDAVNDPPPFSLAPPDLCNPNSIAVYREALRGIGDGGTSLNAFDSWYIANKKIIEDTCAGANDKPLPQAPFPPLPPLPKLDLCDPVSIDAFRAAIAGNAQALADFNAFIDQLTAAGYFTLACPPDDPAGTYVDPGTLKPAVEPDKPRKFGFGPGGSDGNPPPPPGSVPPKAKRIGVPGTGSQLEDFIVFVSGGAPNGFAAAVPGTAETYFVERFNNLFQQSAEVAKIYAGAASSNQIVREQNSGNHTGVRFDFSGAVDGTIINIRMILLGIGGGFIGNDFADSLVALTGNGFSDPVGGAPPTGAGPIDTGSGVFATQTPISGINYYTLRRDKDIPSRVDFLKVPAPNNNWTGTGTGLNWGWMLLVRIVAVLPGGNEAVTVVPSFY